MAKIEFQNLQKSFDDTVVLPKLDLTIENEEFFCLVGPSGCGKTTLLNLIAGLEPVSDGRILFDGKDVTELGPRERDIAMVFQSYALYPHMTVRENIAFPLKVRKTPQAEIDKAVAETSELLGLGKLLERTPRQLSGGQQQRVSLGRALIRRPSVFLLDEPLSNLDAQLRTQMRLELKRLHRDLPVTTVYVTHDQEEAMSLSDRMLILNKGEVQQLGTPQEAYRRPNNAFVAKFLGKPNINLFDAVVDGGRVAFGGNVYPVDGVENFKNGAKVKLGLRPEALRVTAAGEGFSAEVEVVEPMGSEQWVEVKAAAQRLVLKAPPDLKLESGQTVRVAFEASRLHVFHPETGLRL